jgi:hypothetical protein
MCNSFLKIGMSKCKIYFIILILFGFTTMAQTKDTTFVSSCFDCCRPDAYAPFGLMMTDHTHPKKELSFAYYYMNMQMRGNRSGTATISDDEVFKNYIMSPNKMQMQMHMLMMMYGVTDRFTLMVMADYLQNNMSMHMMPTEMMHMHGMNTNVNNMPASSKSSGFGDTKIYGLYNLLGICNQRLVAGFGINIPTGNIKTKGATLLGNDEVLPYNMQLGYGTFGFLPSLTYVKQHNLFSWGGQARATINLGVNSEGYALGNQYSATSWIAYEFFKWMSCSVRMDAAITDKIYGYDPNIALLMNNDPSSNTINYGGKSANAFIGINMYTPQGRLKGNRLSVEYGLPVYQNLNGIQLSQHGTLYAGWSISF